MTYRIKIKGDLACFTNPIFKIERVSYNVITPSAVRGVLDAILWHPGVTWLVHRVEIHAPIRKIQIMRNEVKLTALSEEGIDAAAERTQRHTLALRDVVYVAEVSMRYDQARAVALTKQKRYDGSFIKYASMFERRIAAGQHFQQPYLGCREFAADVALDDGKSKPIDLDFTEAMVFDLLLDPSRSVFLADVRGGVYEVSDEWNQRFALVAGSTGTVMKEGADKQARAKRGKRGAKSGS